MVYSLDNQWYFIIFYISLISTVEFVSFFKKPTCISSLKNCYLNLPSICWVLNIFLINLCKFFRNGILSFASKVPCRFFPPTYQFLPSLQICAAWHITPFLCLNSQSFYFLKQRQGWSCRKIPNQWHWYGEKSIGIHAVRERAARRNCKKFIAADSGRRKLRGRKRWWSNRGQYGLEVIHLR